MSRIPLLVVEDSPADTRLILEHLRDAGFEPDATCVATGAAFRKALGTSFELVITDYRLPDCDAVSILRHVAERGIDVPVIVVSGMVQDELGVELLKIGAADYLLKDRLARLGEAVRRVLAGRELDRQAGEAADRYRLLVEHCPEALFVHQDGIVIYANPAAARLLGATSPDDIVGRPVLDFVHPDSHPLVRERLRQMEEEARVLEAAEEKLLRADGTTVDAEVTGIPIRYGGARAYQVVARDVTEAKRLRCRLAESEQRFRSMVEHATDIITVTDLNGVIRYESPAITQILGYEPEELLGRPAFELMHPDDAELVASRSTEMVPSPGDLPSVEMRFRHKNGSWRFLETAGVVTVDETGEPCVTVTSRDITERHEMERELRETLARARESDRLKSAFLANVSHEVRTPLNVILGYNSIIAEDLAERGDDSLEASFGHVERASKRLLRTIHGILDLSKMEAGSFDLRTETVDFAKRVLPVVSELGVEAERRGLGFVVDVPPGTELVEVDGYCLEGAVRELVDNAVKFTDRGTVSTRLDRDEKGRLRLEVRDEGMGMSPEFVRRAFEPFSQESIGMTRSHEGAGLGLALAKRYLELIDADLELSSEKGRGTRAVVTFRRSVPGTASRKGPRVAPARHAVVGRRREGMPRILVVEDDPSTRAYMAALLRKRYEVVLASDAIEARRSFAEYGGELCLVLMDLSLKGGEDGLSLTRSLRERPEGKSLPIVAVTAHAYRSDREAALHAGCDDFLVKPFDGGDLRRLVARYARGARPGRKVARLSR